MLMSEDSPILQGDRFGPVSPEVREILMDPVKRRDLFIWLAREGAWNEAGIWFSYEEAAKVYDKLLVEKTAVATGVGPTRSVPTSSGGSHEFGFHA
jgi:hypothetical protein